VRETKTEKESEYMHAVIKTSDLSSPSDVTNKIEQQIIYFCIGFSKIVVF
jgi:hypothetical protein